MYPDVVWLTTSERPYGHGLLLGNETLTKDQIAYQERITGKKHQHSKTQDKTEIRIKIQIKQSDKYLIKYNKLIRKFERHPDIFSKTIGLSALFNLRELSASELKSKIANTKTMEGTWWLYRNEIQPNLFKIIDFKTATRYEAYDFETHGRERLLKSGLAVADSNALKELKTILVPLHRFDYPKAFCFHHKVDDKPNVVLRGGGIYAQIFLDDLSMFDCTKGAPIEDLIDWTERHKNELYDCWEMAKQIYFQYYPN